MKSLILPLILISAALAGCGNPQPCPISPQAPTRVPFGFILTEMPAERQAQLDAILAGNTDMQLSVVSNSFSLGKCHQTSESWDDGLGDESRLLQELRRVREWKRLEQIGDLDPAPNATWVMPRLVLKAGGKCFILYPTECYVRRPEDDEPVQLFWLIMENYKNSRH